VAVAGIGASAGGIEALCEFFGAVPADVDLAYGVVLGLAPHHESELATMLSRRSAMPVVEVHDDVKLDLEPSHVCVIAPDRKLEISDTTIGVSRFKQPRGQRTTIDVFFPSLAECHGDGFAVVLSGDGSDGIVGGKAVKEAGGVVLVQDPREATHEATPRAVIAAGIADVVQSVRQLAARLAGLVRQKENPGRGVSAPGGRRVLVVDDSADVANAISVLIRVLGNEVQTAYSGPEALELGAGFRPDVVLLDLRMPQMDGYEVARRLRREPWGADLTLVAVTGWGEEEHRHRAAEAGFDRHVTKPIVVATLEAVLAPVPPAERRRHPPA
jgi:chemotaxis response regulator CheB